MGKEHGTDDTGLTSPLKPFLGNVEAPPAPTALDLLYEKAPVTKCLDLGTEGTCKTDFKYHLLQMSNKNWMTTLFQPSLSHWLLWVD
eukprot:Em0004g622a